MDDRRKSTRLDGPRLGRIQCDGWPSLPCVIRNYSHTGAQVVVDETDIVPEEFLLMFADSISRVHCRLRWRRGGTLGVEYS